MATIAIFLALGGASAFAATQLAKNSVGTKQLKKNAVTTAKLKKNAVTTAKLKPNAVTTAKLKANAVTSAKIQDGAITGTKINSASTPFGQVVAKLRAPGPVAFGSEAPVSIGTYAQPAGETDQFLGSMTVTFDPACTAPRQAIAYIARNPADPNKPTELDVSAIAIAVDETGANGTQKVEFVDGLFAESLKTMTSFEPTATENQSFYAYLVGLNCTAGTGATASNLGVNVIGFK
jgi:hypothetical protein